MFSKVVKNWNALLYLAYSKLESRVFTAAPEALNLVALRTCCATRPSFESSRKDCDTVTGLPTMT